jgi:endonuclease YncB( thermonuclease family)
MQNIFNRRGRLLALILVFLFLILAARGEDFVPHPNFFKAKVLRVHDGDTIYVRLFLISDLEISNIGCRFFGVAAPELNEVDGLKAKAIVQKLIKVGDEIIVEYINEDKYAGRIDARIWLLDKKTEKYFCLNDTLISNKEIFGQMDKNGKKIPK